MEQGNTNAKNAQKFIVSACNKDKMLLASCNEKFLVKVGRPDKSLSLVPKIKVGWIATSVGVKAADHDTFIKSNDVPSAMFAIDAPND